MAEQTATDNSGLMEVSSHPHGNFSWAALDAVDLGVAKEFYGALFGWTFEDMPMGDGETYTIASLHGKPVAGMSQKRPEQIAGGDTHSYWYLNIAVDDVDALAPRLAPAGGRDITGPMDVPGSGRMVMLRDPSNSIIGFWEARPFQGAAYVMGPGVPCWYELYTHDVMQAGDFYGSLLGWTMGPVDFMGEQALACHNNGQAVAMIVPPVGEWAAFPQGWAVYFGSADVEETAARIRALGGAIEVGPMVSADYPFALVRDPQGASFLVVAPPKA